MAKNPGSHIRGPYIKNKSDNKYRNQLDLTSLNFVFLFCFRLRSKNFIFIYDL